MCNVPPKFYQVCRLCLTVVSDSDVVKLSIFDAPPQSCITKNASQQIAPTNKINNRSVITINHRKNDDVPIVIKKEFPATAAVEADNSNALPDIDDNDDGDDSLLDIHERIYTFLAITVSRTYEAIFIYHIYILLYI